MNFYPNLLIDKIKNQNFLKYEFIFSLIFNLSLILTLDFLNINLLFFILIFPLINIFIIYCCKNFSNKTIHKIALNSSATLIILSI